MNFPPSKGVPVGPSISAWMSAKFDSLIVTLMPSAGDFFMSLSSFITVAMTAGGGAQQLLPVSLLSAILLTSKAFVPVLAATHLNT